MQSDSNILKIDNLSKYFGGLAAVSSCSLQIKKGSNEFSSYIISPNIKVYDAYIVLMSNREKTLIVADDKKVYGSLTAGDFKRKISF